MENEEKLTSLANDVLVESRAALAVRFRYLDYALWRMPLVPSSDAFGLSSDGRVIVYDPRYVIQRFQISPNEVIRDLLHCLFHCIFRHPFMLYSVLRTPWDIACDIAIESMTFEMAGDAFPCNMDGRAQRALAFISAQVGGVLTAERLYAFFSDKGNSIDLASLAPMFYHDSHGPWYSREDEEERVGHEGVTKEEASIEEGRQRSSSYGDEWIDPVDSGLSADFSGAEHNGGDDGESDSPDGRETQSDDNSASDGNDDAGNSSGVQNEQDEALKDQWEDIGRRIQMELESHLTRSGEDAGNLLSGLTAVNRECYDYSEFLRKFAVLKECLRVNDDEFDYIYYTYGLKRYGNIPLIEPLEYKEDYLIHEFVIAIDTSESCSGDLVQAFIRKTYNILKQVESFTERVNIHIIQCDARVQEDTKIESLEQLDLYLETMQLHGFGGTDFRPVFEYVDILASKGEFADLRGLIYFTDGQGVYPRHRPAYDVAFVFVDDGYSDPEIPLWSLKLVLDKRELLSDENSADCQSGTVLERARQW